MPIVMDCYGLLPYLSNVVSLVPIFSQTFTTYFSAVEQSFSWTKTLDAGQYIEDEAARIQLDSDATDIVMSLYTELAKWNHLTRQFETQLMTLATCLMNSVKRFISLVASWLANKVQHSRVWQTCRWNMSHTCICVCCSQERWICKLSCRAEITAANSDAKLQVDVTIT